MSASLHRTRDYIQEGFEPPRLHYISCIFVLLRAWDERRYLPPRPRVASARVGPEKFYITGWIYLDEVHG